LDADAFIRGWKSALDAVDGSSTRHVEVEQLLDVVADVSDKRLPEIARAEPDALVALLASLQAQGGS
jgi:hypothetical protein